MGRNTFGFCHQSSCSFFDNNDFSENVRSICRDYYHAMKRVIRSYFSSFFFQITMSVLLVLIIVMPMRHVLIRMDHLRALVILVILETE